MKLRLGASVVMIAAGLIHLVIAPLHWAHAPAHGLFFAASGLAEVVWGIAFWRKPSAALCRVGMVLAGGMIALWAVTRAFPAPFGDEPGEIELTGVASKLLEGLAFAALAALAVSGAASGKVKVSKWLEVGKFAAASLLVGGLIYQIAVVAEPLFPELGEQSAPIAAASSVESPVIEGPVVESATSIPDDLQLVVGGFASPFVNGSGIPIAGDLMVQLTVTPGDERHGRDVELYLYHQTSAKPVDDAAIQATARMRFMDHGTFQQVALNTGAGNYVLLLPFPMPGEWQLELEIVTPDGAGTLRLDIDLFE